MSPVAAFLAGEGSDHKGRVLPDVLAFSDEEIEQHHDYIQWLFPLLEESEQVFDAPVLAPSDVTLLRASQTAQEHLEQAVGRMLAFYEASTHWLVPMDHNHLRITRMLKSVRLLHSLELALLVYDTLMGQVHAAGTPVRPKNLAFWTDAVGLSYEGRTVSTPSVS